MKKVVILASGSGTLARAIFAANKDYEIAALICDRPQAKVIEIANEFGIKVEIVELIGDRANWDLALLSLATKYQPDLIVCAGFMRILTPEFIRHYAGKLINIHPSLLPSFPGLHTHERALEAGVETHGASVHFVSEGVDEGPIICQATVPVLPGDSAAQLASRVLQMEHLIYPRAVKWFLDGRLRIEGNQVKVQPPESQLFTHE